MQSQPDPRQRKNDSATCGDSKEDFIQGALARRGSQSGREIRLNYDYNNDKWGFKAKEQGEKFTKKKTSGINIYIFHKCI